MWSKGSVALDPLKTDAAFFSDSTNTAFLRDNDLNPLYIVFIHAEVFAFQKREREQSDEVEIIPLFHLDDCDSLQAF